MRASMPSAKPCFLNALSPHHSILFETLEIALPFPFSSIPVSPTSFPFILARQIKEKPYLENILNRACHRYATSMLRLISWLLFFLCVYESRSPGESVCMLSCFSHVRLFVTPCTVTHQAPLSRGFSRQEYWSGLPFPSPGDLPNPGIEHGSPALQTDSLLSEPPGKPKIQYISA